jgi:hypothetical protein
MRRIAKVIGWVVAGLVVLLITLIVAERHAPPSLTPGPDAEARAQRMVRAVDGDAWARTGAVRWRMPGRAHLWDRQRGLARVEWSDTRVLLDVHSRRGKAWQGGHELSDGAALQQKLDKAYALWINDSFWLNPVPKAFDDGTSRATATVDGKPALMVSYAAGGLTPGDRYLWILDDDGRPTRWRVYVKILKLIPGLEFSWEGWTRISTGAWIATVHRALGIDVVAVRDLAGAPSLAELEPNDPFAPIL